MNVPTAYEISRIAVALRGPGAAKNPIEAIREALGLWLVAAVQLEEAAKEPNPYCALETFPLSDASERFFAEFIKPEEEALAKLRRQSEREKSFGTSFEDSEPMKWLSENAKDKRDRYKSFPKFESAWTDTFGSKAAELRGSWTVETLKEFEQRRTQTRQIGDASRKRKARANKKQIARDRKKDGQEKSPADRAAEKPVDAPASKPSLRTSRAAKRTK